MLRLITHGHDRRHKEAGAQQHVQRHHDRAHEERRESKQGKDGRDKDAPYRERHAHQCHAAGSSLQDGHYVVQTAHGEADDEHRQRGQHQ